MPLAVFLLTTPKQTGRSCSGCNVDISEEGTLWVVMRSRNAMPRYFFNLRNDHDVNDREGLNCADFASAMRRAEGFAVEMGSVSVAENRHLVLSHRIEVVDEAGHVVGLVRFGDVITVTE